MYFFISPKGAVLNLQGYKYRYIKIHPTEYIGNRQRSKSEYNFEIYKDTLKIDFTNKMKNKRNNKNSALKIRSHSF